MKIIGEFFIPTKKMNSVDLVPKKLILPSVNQEFSRTKFYQENGVCHLDEAGPTTKICFIQRVDSEFFVVSSDFPFWNTPALLKIYLDQGINAEVIECSVPSCSGCYSNEFGPLEFIAQHHPSGQVRVNAIAMLMELNNARPSTGQHA